MNTADSSNNDHTLVSVEQEKKIQVQHIQEERLKRIHTEAVNLVCRQTDYDEITAREKLEIANYNYENVLNDFYGITNKNPDSNITKNNITTNQQIYGEIRNLMDVGARKFRTDQENAELYKKMMSTVD
jgi:hypothetical protein